nr:unnamed protein product [Callosobruchus chinensis]
MLTPIGRPRWIRERDEHFENLDDVDFQQRFRLSKAATQEILDLIKDQLDFSTDNFYAESPMNQLLCTLRYYATACHQMTVGDFSRISKSTACRIIHRVSAALASLRPRYMAFPETAEDVKRAQTEFYNTVSFPRVVGAIDCTHVKIKSPGANNAELFRCRKGFFSLNVQALCNAIHRPSFS